MQIGEVADRTGLTQRTLRYYESIGLLPPATRMEGGFRLYSEADLRRLDQIVQLKKLLGFSLAEIRRIVEADDLLQQIRLENKQEPDPAGKRARLKRAVAIIGEQLDLIRGRIKAMEELQARYERRLDRLRWRITDLESDGGGLRPGSVTEPEPDTAGPADTMERDRDKLTAAAMP